MPLFKKENLFLAVPLLLGIYLLAAFVHALLNLDLDTRHGGVLLAAGWLGLVLMLVRRDLLPDVRQLAVGAALIYLAWGLIAQVTPFSDFGRYLAQATALAAEGDWAGLFESKSPPLVVWHALFQWLLGPSVFSSYLAGALLWAVQGPLLAGTLINFGMDRKTALLAAGLYCLGPGIIAFAPIVSAESLFHALLLLSFYLASGARRWEAGRIVVLAVLQGLLFLTRSNAVVFVIAFGLYLLLLYPANAALRRPGLSIALYGAVFSICLILFGCGKLLSGGEFALTATPWNAGSLMSGTNRETGGRYTEADWIQAGYRGSKRLPFEQANAEARRIGMQRILADPLGFAGFALTTKIDTLWGADVQTLNWATQRSPLRKSWEQRGLITVLGNVINAYWVFLLGACLAGIALLAKRLGQLELDTRLRLAVLVLLPCLLLALAHVFLEVQPRYHMIFMPFIVVSSALAMRLLADRPAGFGGRAWEALNPTRLLPRGPRQPVSGANRRRQRRVPIVVAAEVVTAGGTHSIGRTRDLSIRGVFVVQASPLPIGSECSVSILLETAGRPIRLTLKGKVVRCETEGMAVEFTAMTRECFENLQFVIAHNAAAQRGE